MALLRSLEHDKTQFEGIEPQLLKKTVWSARHWGRLCSSVAVVSHSDGAPQERVLDALCGFIPATGMLSRAPDIG